VEKKPRIEEGKMKLRIIVIFLVVVMLVSGCTSVSFEPTIPIDVVNELKERLGYALAPYYLPEGFEFAKYDELLLIDIGSPVVYLIYSSPSEDHHFVISYPEVFYPEGNPMFDFLGIDLQRPSDAITTVQVNGESAYLIRGFWSEETIEEKIPVGDYKGAVWDYDFYLSLYFEYKVNVDETVGINIMASPYAPEWMTSEELIRIAESIGRVD